MASESKCDEETLFFFFKDKNIKKIPDILTA
jgi:hypothetical protein